MRFKLKNMMPSLRFKNGILLSICAIAFAIAHTQSPLFYSNQNQYLLHGLANGGNSSLSHDWLANTKDPTPLFSFGLAWSYRLAGLWPIQTSFFLILIAYFLLCWALAKKITNIESTSRTILGFAALFITAHAAAPRLLSVKWTGVDYPWFLQAGVAGQYTLGPGLQPSSFAFLLIASLVAYSSNRPYLAAGLAASTSLFHATYLLPAAMLTVGMMLKSCLDRNWKVTIGVGVTSLMFAMPAVIYVLIVFRTEDPLAFAESQRILATIRIPHHASIPRWFDGIAAIQIVWIVIGLVLVRRSVLFVPLLTAFGIAVVLSLIQLATQHSTLALLFPWRLSVILVPLTTAIICMHCSKSVVSIVGLITMMGCAIAGFVITQNHLGYRVNDAERPLVEFVRSQHSPSDIYLIPARFPAVGTGRGSMSASFTPPPRPQPGSNLIPVDFQQFRLASGASIYVDFKSVPYAPDEVFEWYRRMKNVEDWYISLTAEKVKSTLQAIRNEGITHIIVPISLSILSDGVIRIYADEHFAVYQIRSGETPPR